jgi:hypothetical protein
MTNYKFKFIFNFKQLLTIVFVLTLNYSKAQTPITSWVLSSNIDDYDESGSSTVIDKNGDIIVVGTFNSPTITFGNIILSNINGSSMFILKVNASGNVLWAKSEGNVEPLGVNTDQLGNIIITGEFTSSSVNIGSNIFTNNGVRDVFISKYDNNGNLLWAKSAGGINDDYQKNSVSIDLLGNIYTTGGFHSPTITFGTTTLTNSYGSGVFIVKYNANGNIEYAKSEGTTTSIAMGWTTLLDNNENLYVTGTYSGTSITFGNTTLNNSSTSINPEVFTVKYNKFGDVLWAKSYGTAEYFDESYNMTLDNNNNLIVVGMSLLPSVRANSFIFKLDNNGNQIFEKKYTSDFNNFKNGDIRTYNVITNNSGEIFISGVFSKSIVLNSGVILSLGGNDIFILKLDNLGNVIWSKTIGGTGNDVINSFAKNSNGNYYITGNYQSQTINFDSYLLNNTNRLTKNFYLASLSNSTNINQDVNILEARIYPNPTKDQLNILFDEYQLNSNISLYNFIGELINKTTFTGTQAKIERNNLVKGIYFIKISNKNSTCIKKIIIE